MDNQSIYITASELAQVMGVSNGHAYKLIMGDYPPSD